MDEQVELRKLIAKNITLYRKQAGLTQAELAERINYTDKSVSKWERAEGVPDIYVLSKLAEIFDISVSDLLSKNLHTVGDRARQFKIIVSLLSVAIVWLVAVIAYVVVRLLLPDFQNAFLAFIYAVPLMGIVLLVFCGVWHFRLGCCISASIIVWGIPLSVHLSYVAENSWLIYLIGIPLQIMVLLWFLLRIDLRKLFKKKQPQSPSDNADGETPDDK